MLSEDQIQKVRSVLASSGWNDVIRPILANRGNQAVKQLVLSPGDRDGEFKDMADDAIRARIRESEWMLTVWHNEVTVFEMNKRRDDLDAAGGGPAQ